MYYTGLISGTSTDAVDAALCSFAGGRTQVLASRCQRFPAALRRRLRATSADMPLAEVMRLDAVLGDIFADTALRLLADCGLAPSRVAAIGSHGQTLWHEPGGEPPFTVQVADPNRIARRTGIVTVADFRRMDMAGGGGGAPLACAFHQWQFGRGRRPIAVLNIGGIANLTVTRHSSHPLCGYDTGPGNGLMDDWIARHKGVAMDKNGVWAATGRVQADLLEHLLADPYFAVSPPKSSGREYFNLHWLDKRLRLLKKKWRPVDVQATLMHLSAQTMADAVLRSAATCADVLVCGGGVHNRLLFNLLCRLLPAKRVVSTSDRGLDPDYIEAVAFAWLAMRRLRRQPCHLGAVTGADQPAILGGVYQP